MKKQIIILVMGLIFISACTLPSYKGGIEPIYPGVKTFGKQYETVESLTPTFRWKSVITVPCTYDFAIWDLGETLPSGLNGFMVMRGPALYYKEALSKPEHTVEIPLAPDTRYFWSVRIRTDGKVSEWATYDYHAWLVIAASEGRNWPYNFKTPKVEAK
jgi:hypothetical protein